MLTLERDRRRARENHPGGEPLTEHHPDIFPPDGQARPVGRDGPPETVTGALEAETSGAIAGLAARQPVIGRSASGAAAGFSPAGVPPGEATSCRRT